MKISLRELFLLVALAAMGCGWWIHATQLRRENTMIRRAVDESAFGLMRVGSGYRLMPCFGSGKPQELD
jgi:hypothetical protein